MNRKFSFVVLALFFPIMAMSGVRVSSLDLITSGSNGYVKIGLEGKSRDLPEIKAYGNVIEIILPQSLPFASINKRVKGTFLSANTFNGQAIIKAILPYGVSQEKVQLGWKNDSIEVAFPRGEQITSKEKINLPVVETAMTVNTKSIVKDQSLVKLATPDNAEVNKITKDVLNEDYLNKLMKEHTVPTSGASKLAEISKKDVLNIKQAAPILKVKPTNNKSSDSTNEFSFIGYSAKFAVFLVAVLGLFYGVVQLLKKGIFSRGKLSFLNNSQMIQVLSTTYVAPKRSLMIVKAHKQIFLVANSESGLTFLSEMTDTSGLIKEGEKILTGTNFDDKLTQLEAQSGYEAFIKVKENIMESTPVKDEVKGLAKLASAKDDIVKFSDELKKKAKKLKPIEFN